MSGAFEAHYDVLGGRYIAIGMTIEEKTAIQYNYTAMDKDFTPASLRNIGVR